MDWQQIVEKLRQIRESFDRSYKCLNVDRPTKDETVEKHLEILLDRFEQIRVILNVNYSRLTQHHKTAADKLFADIRDKLTRICLRKGLEIKIPETIRGELKYIPKPNTPETQNKFFEENPREITKMPQTITEFLGLASRILPDFDGKPQNMQSFIDALNLVNSLKEDHETVAVNLIKTKLKGSSRALISTETTIQQIIDKLSSTIKGESTEVLTAKLLNVKQNNRSANEFTADIEELTKALSSAYIADGLPPSTAEKYSTQIAVKAMTKNASQEKVKLVMEAGNFATMNDAVAKFVNSCTDTSASSSNIFHYRTKNYGRGRGRRGNNRSNNRGYEGGYNNRGNNRRYGRNYNNFNNYNNSNDNGNNNQRYNNVNRGRNVRLTHEGMENNQAPGTQ